VIHRAALASLLALAACGGQPDGPSTVAIVGATVLQPSAPLADAVVVLDGGHVAALGTRAETPIPKGAALVDGRGLWVVAPEGRALAVGAPATLFVLEGDPRAPGATRVVRQFVAGVER
jgi:hypothetical protein